MMENIDRDIKPTINYKGKVYVWWTNVTRTKLKEHKEMYCDDIIGDPDIPGFVETYDTEDFISHIAGAYMPEGKNPKNYRTEWEKKNRKEWWEQF